jgi:hypothetical protein
MKVQNLDLGLKVLILQEGPHRSMKDHIGTMAMFYIMQNMAMDLLGSSRDLKGPHILWSL